MHTKMSDKQELWWKWVALLTMIMVSLTLFNSPGTGDVNIWSLWIDYARQYGLREGFRMQGDMYPPFAIILQIAIQRIWPGLSNFVVLRLVNIFFLFLSALVIHLLYKDAKVTLTSFWGLILSVNLGYLDIEMVPFMILAFYFLSEEKYVLSGTFFSLLCLIKFQPLIILPFVFIYFVDVLDAEEKKFKLCIRIKNMMKMSIPAILIGGGVLLIYRKALIKALYRALFDSGYAISLNGFNLGWIIQYWLKKYHADQFGPLDGGWIGNIWNAPSLYLSFKYIFIVLYAAAAIVMLLHRKKDYALLLKCSLVGYTAYFVYNCGVHENHLFLGMILMMLLYIKEPLKNNYYRMIMYNVIFNINLFVFYVIGFSRVIGGVFDPTLVLAIFNVIYLSITMIWLIYEVWYTPPHGVGANEFLEQHQNESDK